MIISDEAYTGWLDFAATHRASMTALAEAVGLMLPAGLSRRLETELVTIAQQVDHERRSRRPT